MQITVSTKNTPQDNKIKFPCILEFGNYGLIVLAVKPNHGIVLQVGSTDHILGNLHDGFTFSNVLTPTWKYFQGAITFNQ
jgi:hypothetical protein